MARFVERNQYDWFSTIWKLAIFVAVVLFAILVVYPWKGFLPTFILIIAGLWMYISLISRTSGYICAELRQGLPGAHHRQLLHDLERRQEPGRHLLQLQEADLPPLRQEHQGAAGQARRAARGQGHG